MKHKENKKTLGWGVQTEDGQEMWDDHPIFKGEHIRLRDKLLLFFYPKKLYLYTWVTRYVRRSRQDAPIKIVDIGCGTGAAVIDMKKMFGRGVEICGVDIMSDQVELAEKRIKQYGVWAEFYTYDGEKLPFSDQSIDVIYTSDVLGHVKDVPAWIAELYRVLKPNGEIVMFSESRLGKHAYIRKYLLKKGVNTDPHAEFHISLYSKRELRSLLTKQGLTVRTMISVYWAKFFVHPEELRPVLRNSTGVPIFKYLNAALTFIKKITSPVSTACAELYGLIEMTLFGRRFESQGYLIHAIKETEVVKDDQEVHVKKFTSLPVLEMQ